MIAFVEAEWEVGIAAECRLERYEAWVLSFIEERIYVEVWCGLLFNAEA